MPKKKTTIDEEVMDDVAEEVAPRLSMDFHREDLNEMRDAINELFQR